MRAQTLAARLDDVVETRWLDAEEQRTWRAFLAAVQLLDGALDRQLRRDAGMPLAYYQVLAMLSEAPAGSLRMSELAAATSASQSRLSHAVNRLEEAGWVRRERCPGDRRVVHAVLTEAGAEALAAAAPGHVEAVRRYLFDQLTPAQTGQLRAICQAVLAGPEGGHALPGRPGEEPTRPVGVRA